MREFRLPLGATLQPLNVGAALSPHLASLLFRPYTIALLPLSLVIHIASLKH
jgi:hypothetical protein